MSAIVAEMNHLNEWEVVVTDWQVPAVGNFSFSVIVSRKQEGHYFTERLKDSILTSNLGAWDSPSLNLFYFLISKEPHNILNKAVNEGLPEIRVFLMVEILSGGQLYHAKIGLLVALLIITTFLLVGAIKTILVTKADILLLETHDSDDFIETRNPRGCLGAPYLYVTVHDITANVLKYTRDGCFLSSDILIMGKGTNNNDIEFRSMALGKYKDQEALFATFSKQAQENDAKFQQKLADMSVRYEKGMAEVQENHTKELKDQVTTAERQKKS